MATSIKCLFKVLSCTRVDSQSPIHKQDDSYLDIQSQHCSDPLSCHHPGEELAVIETVSRPAISRSPLNLLLFDPIGYCGH